MSKEQVQEILQDKTKLQKVCKAVFDSVDLDQSGFIDYKELEKTMAQLSESLGLPPVSEKDVQDAYKVLDVNEDGKISLEEFSVLTKQLLEAMAN